MTANPPSPSISHTPFSNVTVNDITRRTSPVNEEEDDDYLAISYSPRIGQSSYARFSHLNRNSPEVRRRQGPNGRPRSSSRRAHRSGTVYAFSYILAFSDKVHRPILRRASELHQILHPTSPNARSRSPPYPPNGASTSAQTIDPSLLRKNQSSGPYRFSPIYSATANQLSRDRHKENTGKRRLPIEAGYPLEAFGSNVPSVETVQTEDDAKLLTEEKLTRDVSVWLLTLLIEDRRADTMEAQVAEIRVRLKAAEKGGFWTDAWEVCERLQSGPFRVDGPAKVYCYRGNYRQIFLSITKDNDDNYVSQPLKIPDQRVLRVIIEDTRDYQPQKQNFPSLNAQSPHLENLLKAPPITQQHAPQIDFTAVLRSISHLPLGSARSPSPSPGASS